MASVLIAGLTGIHPHEIRGFTLITANGECGLHLTTSACCAYHAVEQILAVWSPEQSALVPCSDGPG